MRLDLESDLEVVGQADNVTDTITVAASTRPDVVVLDVRMPPASGLSAITRLRAEVPGLRIVVLSIHDQQSAHSRAFAAGADAFVSKNAGDGALLRAIRHDTDGHHTARRPPSLGPIAASD